MCQQLSMHVVNEAAILLKLLTFNLKFPGVHVLVELGVPMEICDMKKNLNAGHLIYVIILSFDHPLRLLIIQTSFESSSEFR